jgi:hypothetical protein
MVTEHKERGLTRRHFVKLSFGILGLTIQATTLAYLQRLEEVAAWATSAGAGAQATLVPAAQVLQSRPSLNSGLALQASGKGGRLRGQNAQLMLNDSAYFAVWHCDGSATVNEICDALSVSFGVPTERVQEDLVTLFDCLYRLDLMSFTVACRHDQQYEAKDGGTSTWESIAA